MKLGLITACAAGALALAPLASAAEGMPVVVGYTAPPECASDEAFLALLQVQLARTPDAGRPWRFGVAIRHGDDYEGTLTFASSERVLHAATCDDLVAALTLVIAMATPPPAPPAPPAAPEPPPAAVVPIPPADEAAPPVLVAPALELTPAGRDAPSRRRDESPAWRVGVRMQDWNNGSWLSAIGPTAVFSIEPRWGGYKMMFELAGGVLQSNFATPWSGGTDSITWGVLDFQTCPLDIDLGTTGFALLGCTRTAGAINTVHQPSTTAGSGAIWVGGGGRLRWQSPWRLYVELHGNGLWGTQSWPLYGSPGWMDFGGAFGVRI